MPLRIALTKEMHGPDFSSLVYLLGKEEILKRLGSGTEVDLTAEKENKHPE